jgi:hypothetical protein
VLAGVRLLSGDKEKAIAELIPGIKTYTRSPKGTGENRTSSRIRQAETKLRPQSKSRGNIGRDHLDDLFG